MRPTSLGEVAAQTYNHNARSVPSSFDAIAQNKAQTSSPKGGREGKILQEYSILSALTLLNTGTQANSEELF